MTSPIYHSDTFFKPMCNSTVGNLNLALTYATLPVAAQIRRLYVLC